MFGLNFNPTSASGLNPSSFLGGGGAGLESLQGMDPQALLAALFGTTSPTNAPAGASAGNAQSVPATGAACSCGGNCAQGGACSCGCGCSQRSNGLGF